MKAEPLQNEAALGRNHEVIDIRYSVGQLAVTVADSETSTWVVTFEDVAGFRVLDEGDLLEFWPECSSPRGWLFRILEGGWFDQESQRSGFLARDTKKVTEYLITGADDCVSVLSWSEPSVSRQIQQGASADAAKRRG